MMAQKHRRRRRHPPNALRYAAAMFVPHSNPQGFSICSKSQQDTSNQKTSKTRKCGERCWPVPVGSKMTSTRSICGEGRQPGRQALSISSNEGGGRNNKRGTACDHAREATRTTFLFHLSFVFLPVGSSNDFRSVQRRSHGLVAFLS
jgi:hypothetical protein